MTETPVHQEMTPLADDQEAAMPGPDEGPFDSQAPPVPVPPARTLPRRLSPVVSTRAHQLDAMLRQALAPCIRTARGVIDERFGLPAGAGVPRQGHSGGREGRLPLCDFRWGRRVPSVPSAPVRWTSACGVVGTGIYLAGFALPLPGNLPLLGLVLCSLLVVATGARALSPGRSPLPLAVVAFLGATVVSTLVSVDVGRSVRLSTPFLPAVLLFFLVAQHVASPREIRRLYLTLSAVALVLASMVLWAA